MVPPAYYRDRFSNWAAAMIASSTRGRARFVGRACAKRRAAPRVLRARAVVRHAARCTARAQWRERMAVDAARIYQQAAALSSFISEPVEFRVGFEFDSQLPPFRPRSNSRSRSTSYTLSSGAPGLAPTAEQLLIEYLKERIGELQCQVRALAGQRAQGDPRLSALAREIRETLEKTWQQLDASKQSAVNYSAALSASRAAQIHGEAQRGLAAVPPETTAPAIAAATRWKRSWRARLQQFLGGLWR